MQRRQTITDTVDAPHTQETPEQDTEVSTVEFVERATPFYENKAIQGAANKTREHRRRRHRAVKAAER